MHVGEHEVEDDRVVVVVPGHLEGFLAGVDSLDDGGTVGLEHEVDGAAGQAVIIDEEHTHFAGPCNQELHTLYTY